MALKSVAEIVPGSAADPRGLPNSPFSINSRRLSDGMSSVSPLTTTAPSFASGRDAQDTSVAARQNHTDAVEASEDEQGASDSHSGYFQIEVARWRYEQTTAAGAPAPSIEFAVDAAERWNPSSFAIQRDATYRIEVPGAQTWMDGAATVGANGYVPHYDAVQTAANAPVMYFRF